MSPAHPEAETVSGPDQAAQAIVELINSQPRSPRLDEIADIVRKFIPQRIAAAPCSHCQEALDREYGPVIRRVP
jgi:hypothetical protein